MKIITATTIIAVGIQVYLTAEDPSSDCAIADRSCIRLYLYASI